LKSLKLFIVLNIELDFSYVLTTDSLFSNTSSNALEERISSSIARELSNLTVDPPTPSYSMFISGAIGA